MSGSEWFYFGFSTFFAVMLLGFAAWMHYEFRDGWKTAWVPPIWMFVGLFSLFMVGAFFAIFSNLDEDYAGQYQGQPATSLEPGTYYVVSAGDDLINQGQTSDHLHLVLAESEGDDDFSYQFVSLLREKIDESQGSLRAGEIYAITKVTTCYTTSACQTLYHFEIVFAANPDSSEPEVPIGGGQSRT